MTDYVLLRSWDGQGWFLEGEGAVEIIEGNRDQWSRIPSVLDRYRSKRNKAGLVPWGGALGYFSYEGDYWLGVYPELRLIPAPWASPRWQARKAQASRRAVSLDAWEEETSREQWVSWVRLAQEYIRSGDIYQVNLSHRLRRRFSGNLYRLFEELFCIDPAPGSAFLETPAFVILCASPELFLRVEGDRIVTRPIKGTRPRGRTFEEDARLAKELRTHPKELAELVMITDLERNDLGAICQCGSIRVSGLTELESFPFVHHLVSTVEGRLRRDVGLPEILTACFPGGSVTGAPKKRAMEIISELEASPRGVYTGALGMLGFDGDLRLTMAIRVLVWDRRREELWLRVGSGITIDSDPELEYQETLQKARSLQKALSRALGEENP
jgi:para-aminobenzoate synthetase component 1